MMATLLALMRANPKRGLAGGLVVALIVALGISRCQREEAQQEARKAVEGKARIEERAHGQAEVIQNVQKAQEAVTRRDDARTERLRSRWDRARQDGG